MAQFPQHRISNTDDLRSGNAVSPNRVLKGVPLTGAEAQSVVVLSLGAPIAAAANGVAASQSVGAAANFLINGALASNGVATFATPRNVVAAWTTTSILTIRGTDVYGQLMVEVSASGVAHAGQKAFKTITSITSSASITGATVGNGDVLGLPYRPALGGFISGIVNENTTDAGVYVAPIRTTSTGTSVDVRGTYDPAATLNGTNVILVRVAFPNGPNDSDAFGIAQFATG